MMSHELLARYSQTYRNSKQKVTIKHYETPPLHSYPVSAYIVFLARNFRIFFDLFVVDPSFVLFFFLTFFHHRKTQFLQLGTWSAEVWSKLPKPMRPMALNVRIAQNVVILDTS